MRRVDVLARTVTAGIAGVLLLTACGARAVSVPAPTPSGVSVAACLRLAPVLPGEVLGAKARPTSPDSPYTAAWGDPPITLRCGQKPDVRVADDAQLITVNGVAWYPQTLERGTSFTTIDLVAQVRVEVPSSYSPEAGALPTISDAVKKAVPALTS